MKGGTVSELAISAWERKANNPRLLPFAKAASCLRVPLSALGRAPDITAARASLGLTQEALAHLLGVSRSMVQEWEAGRRQPPARVMERLCSFLRETDSGPCQEAKAGIHAGVPVFCLDKSDFEF